ncbi:unnamed protein product [Dovyalis caffra]|uniref:CNNM transmembrane domain-containing protein n=1 Tax=Dovyalis caffra TaxID=77055 RepID=A0AAV1RRQ3_9ROSI|nr:unnamed protein product [Dovyalis caffra]
MKDTNVPCCELEFWAYLIISFILISLAGITSGLALGLLSFSQVELEVFVKSGLPQDQKNAAILMSVTLVLAFAEIIPQAVCARYGLSVGAKLSVFVRFLLLVFYPIAYPISKLLDWLLGKAHSALLRRAELKTLVCLHANEAGKGGDLSHHETTIISGVLDLTQKTAKDAMTPISESFTLNINSKLDMQTMRLIMSKGHSRIPVYSGSPNNVIGLILVRNSRFGIDLAQSLAVKSLIFCHPEDETPIKSMPIRRIPRVTEDFALYSILNQFQKGHSHMAVVVKRKEDLKSTVNHAVFKHSKLEIVTHPNPKTTQAERKANIDDRGISSPFYQIEYSDISTNASPLYSNNKDYQSPKQNKDLNTSRKSWEKREKNISYEDLESLRNDLEEEVIGIITMEDVLEELLRS